MVRLLWGLLLHRVDLVYLEVVLPIKNTDFDTVPAMWEFRLKQLVFNTNQLTGIFNSCILYSKESKGRGESYANK